MNRFAAKLVSVISVLSIASPSFAGPNGAGRRVASAQIAELKSEIIESKIDSSIKRTLAEYGKLKNIQQFQDKFLKGLSQEEAQKARKALSVVKKLPIVTQDGLTLKVQLGKDVVVIDCAELPDKKLRFNGQVLHWNPNDPLSNRIKYLQKKLEMNAGRNSALLELLFPRAHAILPALGALGLTGALIVGGFANQVIAWYSPTLLRTIDTAVCKWLVDEKHYPGIVAWGPCQETVKGMNSVAAQPEADLTAGKSAVKVEELAKQFEEQKGSQQCDIKDGKTFSTKVLIKARKEIVNVKLNIRADGTGEIGLLTDPDTEAQKVKMELDEKSALKKATVKEPTEAILERDAANKIDHLKAEEKAKWQELKDLLSYLDSSVGECVKKIRDKANAVEKVADRKKEQAQERKDQQQRSPGSDSRAVQ